MTQPIPLTSFSVNLLRVQVPSDDAHPTGEAVIIEFIPIIDNVPTDAAKAWFMCSPDEAINFGRGIIAEGELARTGLVLPDSW